MLNAPSFSEDMLPRHFPRTNEQLVQKSAVVPMPTLPGLSLLLDDDKKVIKAEPKVEPRKSFEQWKQQNKAIFIDDAVTQRRKPEKKQVRFETDKQSNCYSNEKPSNQRTPPPMSPNLELSYCEDSRGGNFCQNQRATEDYHYPNHDTKETGRCDGFERNILLPQCKYKPTNPSFASDKAYNAARQTTTVDLPNFNRMVRSESVKENFLSATNSPVHNEQQRQCAGNCCQTNQRNWEMLNYPTCNHGMQPNRCVDKRQVHQFHQPEAGHKTTNPFHTHVERDLKEQLTDGTLQSIMEEQQQHILLQQGQILMQQKQNMMQQKQIFMLQHQVQQLLQRNGTNPSELSNKMRQTSICEKAAPRTPPNALQNAINIRSNESTDSTTVANGATRTSIGVMTSFLGGNVTDGIPNGMQQFNERFSKKLVNEKFIENMGGLATNEEYSYKDSMLDKINDAIKNSSAMIDYRNNGTVNGCASPNRQADINISAQALFYETSSTKEQKTTDRSFALYMLGMKYDCAQDDASKNVDKRDWNAKHTNGKTNDQVSVNLSPEVYDYLKRHGLL